MSDEAVRVGPPVAAESYLNMEAVFNAIEATGAQAVSTCMAWFLLVPRKVPETHLRCP